MTGSYTEENLQAARWSRVLVVEELGVVENPLTVPMLFYSCTSSCKTFHCPTIQYFRFEQKSHGNKTCDHIGYPELGGTQARFRFFDHFWHS